MHRLKRNTQGGFTLLEILLVVVIIGMLVGVAVVKLGGKVGEANDTTAKDQIHNFETALSLYELDCGFLPTTEQGLAALVAAPSGQQTSTKWKGPYLQPAIVRKDPWEHDYIYRNPGTHNTTSYDISSPGKDGIEGNGDDLTNWQ